MFYLHSSNKTENLLEHLLAVLQAAPLSSPFSKECFLIQSQGMERWLSQQIASRLQIWANYEFLFPAKFFSTLAGRLDSKLNDAGLDRNVMLWRFEALLRHVDEPVFKPLQHYLQGECVDLKRFQLAQQLARIFDQYQIMRPDMLDAWLQGKVLYEQNLSEQWQSTLWRTIMTELGNRHRGSLWLDVIQTLHTYIPGHFSPQLPERLSIFGVNTMPPLFLDFLQGIALHCDVHFYLLNPTSEFWADIDSKRQRAANMLEESFTGHPLLVNLGQQGREFQDILLNQVQFDLELDSFEPCLADTGLQRLQHDILQNLTPGILLESDDSIGIHACHSRMREVEVLKNLLLQALEGDKGLELRDIVVMAPDIQVYEPFIAAVFNDVQHAIADRSLRISNTALDAFIRFMQLSQSRLGWQSVMDLLEQSVVYSSFGLDESDLDLIKHWVSVTQVRWGQSAQHKQQLGLPELAQNTWQAALDRLLMGYSVGSDSDFVEGILPFIDIEGVNTLALGALHDFLNLIFNAREQFAKPKTVAQWQEQLTEFTAQLLLGAPPLELQQLYELLTELSEKIALVHHDTISVGVIIKWLETRVAEEKSSNGFLRGQLTFCSMLPMRSIPFKVIALLGMNEGEFPSVDRPPSFDLLAQDFRKGDRSSRADDRYQFLEILLSVRQQLIITYIGQSITQNEPISPSVVVSDLMDVLQQHYQWQDMITRHPLQAYNQRYFQNDTRLFSYHTADCHTAIALQQPKSSYEPWWQGKLDVIPEPIIELADLLRFYQHPQKFFLQQQMGLRLQRIEAEADEREPFVIAPLDKYIIQHHWIKARLQGENLTLEKLQAQGGWLSGAVGELEYMRQQPEIDRFVARIQAKELGRRIDDLPVDITVGHFRLIGTIAQRYQKGYLFYRYAELKGKDFLVAWLQHLLINQVTPSTTYLLSKDSDLEFAPEQATGEQLAQWIAIYQAGLSRPDAFFVEPAFAYVKHAIKLQQGSKAVKSPLEVAVDCLTDALENPYDLEIQQLFKYQQDLRQLLSDEFEATCEELLVPIWADVCGAE